MNKITATFFLPKTPVPIGEVVPGELPKQLQLTSRVIPNSMEINGKEFHILLNKNYDDEKVAQIGLLNYEAISIETVIDIEDQQQALEQSAGTFETICDNLAFKMQTAIYLHELWVQRIDENHIEKGEGLLFPFPHGYQPEKFMRPIFVNQQGEISPDLKYVKTNITKEIAAALKWYHKALVAPFEIDKFIFFFIICEILCKRNQTKIKQFYINPSCKHEIKNCPVCKATTEKIVNGASIKSFLENECNVTPEISKQIWNYRQILHGANDAFIPKNNLPQLVLELQEAITNQIKTALDIPLTNTPIINKDVPPVSQMALTTMA